MAWRADPIAQGANPVHTVRDERDLGHRRKGVLGARGCGPWRDGWKRGDKTTCRESTRGEKLSLIFGFCAPLLGVLRGRGTPQQGSFSVAEFNQVYARAAYYDIAFRRDIEPEVKFIMDEYARLNGRPLSSVLEIACGPGYHVRAFVEKGVRATGLDLRPEIIDFARKEAEALGISAEWIAADMRGFSLPAPVDAIITMYDSIDCLSAGDDLVDHFRTVSANLNKGGIYLFEVTHPRDCSMWSYGRHKYEGERDGTKVEIIWAVNDPVPDMLTQIAEVETILRVTENGNVSEFRDRARERFTLPQEFVALIKLAGGLDVVDVYGDFVQGLRMDNSPASRRMIFVLRKSG